MQANIVYFDENITNHLKIKSILSKSFKTSFYNNRETLLESLSKNHEVNLVLIDDAAKDEKFFDFLNSLLIVIDRHQVGLVLISSLDIVENRVKAFDYGVDDFVIRPVSPNELNARLANKVKKYTVATALKLSLGNIVLNVSDQKAYINSEDRQLTPIEFKILLALVRSPDCLHSKEELVEALWIDNKYGKSKSIDTHICNLRRKLKGFDYSIKASKGRGISLVRSNHIETTA